MLLAKAAGDDVASVFPATADLAPLSPIQQLKGHVDSIRQELCPQNSLFQIPAVALLKLATLRWTAHDGFLLEHFGALLYRDANPPVGAEQRMGIGKTEIYSSPPGKDIWAALDSLLPLHLAISGLADAADKLLHPDILSSKGIWKVWRRLTRLFASQAGRAAPRLLDTAFKSRLTEHAGAVQ